jgi:type 1 glutamine amidotransferase
MIRGYPYAFAVSVACTQFSQPLPSAPSPAPAAILCRDAAAPLRVLLYTKQGDWDHASNRVASDVLGRAGVERGWLLTSSPDAKLFSPAVLSGLDIVVFLLTSGNTLGPAQRAAFEAYIHHGGGFVGVHSASFTESDWPFMRSLVGARFAGHPAVQEAAVLVDDPSDVSVAHLPRRWMRTDEWYTFDTRPEQNPALHLLLSLEEPQGYPGGDASPALRVGRHPLAWRQEFEGGYALYTALGHTVESWAEPLFVEHVARGIESVGAAPRLASVCH